MRLAGLTIQAGLARLVGLMGLAVLMERVRLLGLAAGSLGSADEANC